MSGRTLRSLVPASLLSLLSLAGTAQAVIPASERAVLLDLYASTNGASWTWRTNWNGPAGTECTWYGVQCDAGGTTVTSISLEVNNLSGSLPSNINALTNLEIFAVSGNQLTGPIPALSGLTSLSRFYAGGNQLTGSIPALTGLTNLVQLYVQDNQLTGSIPALSGLTSLAIFHVNDNQLTGSIPALTGLTRMYSFDASGNLLTGPLPALAGLTNLNFFIVSDNHLTGSIPALSGLTSLAAFYVNDNHLTGSIPALIGLARLSQFRVDSNQLTGNVPAAPSPSALMAGRSSLCPNSLNHTTDPAWDAATGITPWYTNCVDSLPPGGYAPGTTFVISDTNASPTGITYLSVVCPASGSLLMTGSGESAAVSSRAGLAFIGLAFSIARDSASTDNANVVQSSALAVFYGDVNRDLINVQRIDSCTPGATHIYRLTAYRTTPDTSATSFVWNGRLTASEPLTGPGTGFAAGITPIGSAANAPPTIVTTLPVTCPAAGAVSLSGSGESTALSTNASTALIGLAYSIARDSFATDNGNLVQSSALAVFNGDANRDFINVQRIDSCTPGATHAYRLTAYRTTPDTSANSFVWNGRLTASVPLSSPGTGFTAGALPIGSSANAVPTIVTTLQVTCPATGAVLVNGSGESAAQSSFGGTAFIGLAYSIARDSLATDNANVVQSSALATFDGDANRDFLNVQRVDSCMAGTTSTYRLTAYRTTTDTGTASFVWNGRLVATFLP